MKLEVSENDLKLKYPFAISRHTYYSQQNVVIRLQHQGYAGLGEATVNPYYEITIDNLKASLEGIRGRLADYDFQHPDQLYEDFSSSLQHNSFALGALNNASWDLYGKMVGQPVSHLLGLSKKNTPVTSYTLGIDTREKMLEKMRANPWPVYKIKLGTPDDIGLVEFMRQHTDAVIRVDANCAWEGEETIRKSVKLKALGVEFIEQPLPVNHAEQQACFERSALPLMADESCCRETDVGSCKGRFHGINIKLLKCGGLTPAKRMILSAREAGLTVMIGCMTESSIGISAAAQLLPFVDYADLDGPLLLAEDLAGGLSYEQGYVRSSGRPGLGIY